MITSKFKLESIINFLFIFFIPTIGSVAFLIKVIQSIHKNEIWSSILGGLFFGTLFMISIMLLGIYKYLKIDVTKKELTYYSLINPFGKTIRFNDFIGFIQSTEITVDEEINTIHFVNQQGFTQFKINSSHYKNAKEINHAIPLKEIKGYDFGTWLYLKLIFTGRIKVTSMDKNKKTG